jgi:medium-chain acyl-[acyl-carrier-protein] hydrolase
MSQSTTAAPTLGSWTAGHEPNPQARLRLFCFPYAGGSALMFRIWSNALPADVEACPIQLPGRSTRLMERPFTDLSSLIQVLAQALSSLLDKPFAIFGHSLGALMGFELARQLRRQYGVSPARLFISAGCAPQIPRRGSPIHTLPAKEFLAEVRRLNGIPKEVVEHDELMEIVIPLLRADFALYEAYVYSAEPPLNCPISAFGGLQDRKVTHRDLEAWRDQTTGAFSLRMLPGDHFFLNTTQPLLLQMLSQELHRGIAL